MQKKEGDSDFTKKKNPLMHIGQKPWAFVVSDQVEGF